MSIYQVFDSEEDTGIPDVRQFVQKIAEQKEEEETKRLIKTLDLLINEIKDYLTENEITVSVGEGLNSKDFYLHIFLFRNCFIYQQYMKLKILSYILYFIYESWTS